MFSRLACDFVLAICLVVALTSPASGQIVVDGRLGPRAAVAKDARGTFAIDAARSGRLSADSRAAFFSFEQFQLKQGETASFSGPGSVRRVFSRVTGGQASTIDGTIQCLIPSADFYFLNPAGVIVGLNAKLDVDGSVHILTANEVRFEDGRRFAVHEADDAVLTSAPPVAFGFLTAQTTAGVRVDGASLRVPSGKTLDLVGGEIGVRRKHDGPGGHHPPRGGAGCDHRRRLGERRVDRHRLEFAQRRACLSGIAD